MERTPLRPIDRALQLSLTSSQEFNKTLPPQLKSIKCKVELECKKLAFLNSIFFYSEDQQIKTLHLLKYTLFSLYVSLLPGASSGEYRGTKTGAQGGRAD